MTSRALFPTFATDVLSASRDFYTGLGFEVTQDGCGYVHLAWPGEPGPQIGFIQRGLQGQAPVYQTRFRGGGVFLGFEVDDVDLVFDKLRKQGHRIVVPLTSEPWGRRHFGILDPNGADRHLQQCAAGSRDGWLCEPGRRCLEVFQGPAGPGSKVEAVR